MLPDSTIEVVVLSFSAAADGRAFSFPGDGFFVGGYSSSTARCLVSKDPTMTIANTLTSPGDQVRFGFYLVGGASRPTSAVSFRVPVFSGETWYASADAANSSFLLLERLSS